MKKYYPIGIKNLINKKMKKITLLLILLPLFFYAQNKKYPITKIIDNDTVIIFSLFQSKELIKINESKKECNDLLNVSNLELSEKDKIIKNQNIQINNFTKIVSNKDTIINKLYDNIELCVDNNKELKSEIKRQKRHKIISVLGLFCVAILGIVF